MIVVMVKAKQSFIILENHVKVNKIGVFFKKSCQGKTRQ